MRKYFQEAKRNAREMLKESKVEYKKYVAGEGIIYLQQASEKLFNAFNRYLELKHEKQMFSHKMSRKYASFNMSDDYIMKITDKLHRFFYHGESFEDTSRDEIEQDFNVALQKIESKINNL